MVGYHGRTGHLREPHVNTVKEHRSLSVKLPAGRKIRELPPTEMKKEVRLRYSVFKSRTAVLLSSRCRVSALVLAFLPACLSTRYIGVGLTRTLKNFEKFVPPRKIVFGRGVREDFIGRQPVETRKPLWQPPFALLSPRGFFRPGENEEHQHRHNDDDQHLLRTKQYGQHGELLQAPAGFAIGFPCDR